MSIRWDAVLVRGMGRALEERFGGSRLRAVSLDHGRRTVILYFRGETLTFHLHPARGDLVLDPAREPDSDARSLPAVLESVEVPFDDRCMRLRLRRVRGRPARLEIVLELMTNQWNALLVEAESGTIRHVLWTREAGDRTLRSGAVYKSPASWPRAGPDAVSLDAWRMALGASDPETRRRTLLSRFAYTSAINVPALTARPPDDAYVLWSRIVGEPADRPCVLRTDPGLQPYPRALPPLESTPAPDLFRAFEVASEGLRGGGDRVEGVSPGLMEALERALDRARRKESHLRRELWGTPEAGDLRGLGHLLLARIQDVPSGVATVTLEGFDGAPRDVELDPRLSPAENAQAYYARAARAERASSRLPGLVDRARREREALEAFALRVRAGEATADEVRARVLPEHADRPTPTPGPALPYRVYRSSGGLEIRVGRGAKHNDDLTFHHSAPNDVWLHARHAAGAHVVLRWSEVGNPPARDLREAAILAALNSKARTSGTVPVDWTRRKYVRKPRKAPRGVVTIDRASTLFVSPDPAVEVALATADPSPAAGNR